jgi:hypothetical protein
MEAAMQKMHCIARAYRDEPLERYVTGRSARVVYVANPSALDAGGLQGKLGIGFPPRCVFRFEKSLFDRLLAALESGDSHQLRTLWGEAQTLDVPK